MSRATLPEQGKDWATLEAEMRERAGNDVAWRDGKLAVYIFNAGEDAMHVAHEAYGMFISENGLGPMAFPSIAGMEQEVIDRGLSLLNAPEDGFGSLTSGGSESIYLAVKACRDQAKKERGLKPGEGQLIVPRSAHPAFDKAAHALELEIVRVPINMEAYEADVDAMAAAITDRTIMLVGSAPNFPYGIVDPIPALSDLAVERDIWLHVDACVGGYFAPFAEQLGADIPAFDFRNPGVMSMSADLHKYGYAAKGASTVLHRSKDQGMYQTFTFDDWPGGHMYTPNMAGTRPGGAIAAAWAVMTHLGVAGYMETTRKVIAARKIIQDGIAALDGVRTLGDPQLGLIAFEGTKHPSGKILGGMMARGWFSAFTTEPSSMHLMLSPKHLETAPAYVEDLKAVLAELDEADGDAAEASVNYAG